MKCFEFIMLDKLQEKKVHLKYRTKIQNSITDPFFSYMLNIYVSCSLSSIINSKHFIFAFYIKYFTFRENQIYPFFHQDLNVF